MGSRPPATDTMMDLYASQALTAAQGAIPASVVSSASALILSLGAGGCASWKAQLSTLPGAMTLDFAASYDGGATFHPLTSALQVLGGTGSGATTTSANNVASDGNTQTWSGDAAGMTHLAVWCSVFASTVTVSLNASSAPYVAPPTAATTTVTANAGTNLNTSALALEAGGHLASMDAKMTALIGGGMPVDVVNFPASTVLGAGAAKIGTVTTDQTTHGTSDLVAADLTKLAGTAVDVNSGNKSAGTLRVVLATDQPAVPSSVADGADTALGTTTDASTANTVIGRLKNLLSRIPAALGATTGANSLPVVLPTDQANLPVKAFTAEFAGLSITSATSLLSSQDCGTNGYVHVAVQITGVGVGTLTFQTSNDGTNWLSCTLELSSATNNSPVSTTSAVGLWHGAVPGRYFRVQCTAYTSGTFTGVVELSTVGAGSAVVGIAGAVTFGVGSAGAGASNTGIISAASTNATNLKASAGALYSLIATNTTASMKFVKLYNKASSPTVGTDVPVYRIGIPANGTVVHVDPMAWKFATGIGYAITGAAADADTTAVAAGDVLLNISYI